MSYCCYFSMRECLFTPTIAAASQAHCRLFFSIPHSSPYPRWVVTLSVLFVAVARRGQQQWDAHVINEDNNGDGVSIIEDERHGGTANPSINGKCIRPIHHPPCHPPRCPPCWRCPLCCRYQRCCWQTLILPMVSRRHPIDTAPALCPP